MDRFQEESVYDSICMSLLMSGDYDDFEHEIEYKAWEIMDNPHIYPEFFPYEQTNQ